MNEPNRYLSVTELNEIVAATLDSNPALSFVLLAGEISNFKPYPSGHIYFSLKDDNSLISAVMWRTYVPKLSFQPKNGDQVLVRGKIGVYASRGTYQISVFSMEKKGQGDALKNLRLLAEKLRKEGLFDESRKKAIPAFPNRISVIAGTGSAGLRDIQVNLAKRWPLAEVCCFPAIVQGELAPKSLLEALKKAVSVHPDTIIIGRGGGSSEDLQAFNDETLVRAVSAVETPLIAAVGHEIDVTLIDLVADCRVSTPTAAAVKATPDQYEVYQALDEVSSRLDKAVNAKISALSQSLLRLSDKPYFKDPSRIYDSQKEAIASLERILNTSIKNALSLSRGGLDGLNSRLLPSYRSALKKKEAPLDSLSAKLDSLNPEAVLSRGYSIMTGQDGRPITESKNLRVGEVINTRLRDGIIKSKIVEKETKDA